LRGSAPLDRDIEVGEVVQREIDELFQLGVVKVRLDICLSDHFTSLGSVRAGEKE